MASVVVDRVWRDTAADDIEAALTTLWREIGTRSRVARAVMSNLIVVRACAASEPADAFAAAHAGAIDEIVARHPSRVIVIAHEDGCPLTREPVAVRVSVATYGPPQAQYAVEHVLVRSSCDDESLPSIVRRLTRGDVPTSVWYPDDLSRNPPRRAIVAEGRQLIYDSRRWSDPEAALRGVVEASRGLAVDVADVNWRRLAPVRIAIRHVQGEVPAEPLRRGALRIAHAPGERALASLLLAWLGACLAWPRGIHPSLVEDAAAGAVLTLTIADASTPLIVLTDNEVHVTPPAGRSYVSATPRERPTDAIIAELRSLSTDAALRAALARLTSATSS
jgi:glucose-6-phosphate dehydrogenase assembly protein OpcA